MLRFVIILSLFLVTACASQSTAVLSEEIVITPSAQESAAQEILASPPATFTETIPPSTSTPIPTIGITPTETSLPALELPTTLANPPALQAWDGTPTYPGDSNPDYLFRVRYDPEIWALTTDSYGYPAIGHRSIEYCVISPAFGRGLPRNINVEHDMRKIGAIDFEINTAYLNGVKQFVTYLGGNGNIYTGFEVQFTENADRCLLDAEVVFATLASVKVTQGTPVP